MIRIRIPKRWFNPWKISTLILAILLICSIIFGWRITGLLVAPEAQEVFGVPTEGVCSGIEGLVAQIKGGELIGGFQDTGDEVCRENGKPVVYIFGRSSCPHCRWLHPIITRVAQEFGDLISFYDNMDKDSDREIYDKYGRGYIPLTVIGCKYVRTGTMHEREDDKEAEANEIRALICSLLE